MDKVLKSKCLFKLLEWIDADLASRCREGGCRHCGERRLHKGDFDRKPRGPDAAAGWDERYSFDCSRCRRRTTPPSVRFLGRKVYIGVVVVLAGAMMHGATAERVEQLRQELGVGDAATLKRWRQWWQENFVGSGFWKVARSRCMPAAAEDRMPLSLVETFGAEHCCGLVSLLRFLSPITVPGGLEGRAM